MTEREEQSAAQPDDRASPRPLPSIPLENIEFGPLLPSGVPGELRQCRWDRCRVSVRTLKSALLEKPGEQNDPAAQSGTEAQTPGHISGQKPGQSRDSKERDKVFGREVLSLFASLCNVHHPNIVEIYGMAEGVQHQQHQQHQHIHILMEPIDSGCLRTILDAAKGVAPWNLFLRYATHVALALEFLHADPSKPPFRDLRSENIYITNSCAKLAEMGFILPAEELGTPTKGSISCIGNITRSPPECFNHGSIRGEHLGEKSDVYMYGMILWEMTSGLHPFQSLMTSKVISKIIQGVRPPIPGSVPKVISELIRLCWQSDPNKRPTFQSILHTLKSMAAPFPHTVSDSSFMNFMTDTQRATAWRGERPEAYFAHLLISYDIPGDIANAFAVVKTTLFSFMRMKVTSFQFIPTKLHKVYVSRLIRIQMFLVPEVVLQLLQESHDYYTSSRIQDICELLELCLEKRPDYIPALLLLWELYTASPKLIPSPRDTDVYTDLIGRCKAQEPSSKKETRDLLRCLHEEHAEIRNKHRPISSTVYGVFLQYVDDDLHRAVECYRLSEENNSLFSQFHLGLCYYYGFGIEKNTKNSFTLFSKAAEQGHIHSLYYLGLYYSHGIMESDNGVGLAYQTYRKAAELGHPYAQNNIGVCFKHGRGVPRNLTEAFSWFRKSSELGVANAQYNIAVCLKSGQGVEKNASQSIQWFLRASKQGHCNAQVNLGFCFENGDGIADDIEQALVWYRKAAEQNNSRAQYNLGLCYEHGRGVEVDYTEAASWYKKAAAQGDAFALANLGDFYEQGKGVAQSRTEALRHFKMAVSRGNTYARHALAQLEFMPLTNAAIALSEQNRQQKTAPLQ